MAKQRFHLRDSNNFCTVFSVEDSPDATVGVITPSAARVWSGTPPPIASPSLCIAPGNFEGACPVPAVPLSRCIDSSKMMKPSRLQRDSALRNAGIDVEPHRDREANVSAVRRETANADFGGRASSPLVRPASQSDHLSSRHLNLRLVPFRKGVRFWTDSPYHRRPDLPTKRGNQRGYDGNSEE